MIRARPTAGTQPPEIDPVVRYVVEKTSERDTIFVWGFRAETYISAHRFPASRFVYTVYPSGVVPWFQATREEEERRTVPGSRELLLEDLEHWRPQLGDRRGALDERAVHVQLPPAAQLPRPALLLHALRRRRTGVPPPPRRPLSPAD